MYYLIRIDQIENNNVNFLKKVNPDIYYAFYKWKLSLYHNRCKGEPKEIIDQNEKDIDNLLAICHLKKHILFKSIGYYNEDRRKIIVLQEPFSYTTIEVPLSSIAIYEINKEQALQYISKITEQEKSSLVNNFTKFKINKENNKSDKIISLQQYKMRKS